MGDRNGNIIEDGDILYENVLSKWVAVKVGTSLRIKRLGVDSVSLPLTLNKAKTLTKIDNVYNVLRSNAGKKQVSNRVLTFR